MPVKHQLDSILEALAHEVPPCMPDDFMEKVWERVGEMNARRERTFRAALFAGLFAVGLGAGAGTVQVPVYAQSPTYLLSNDARLSPSALLHTAP
jgi:hypothetical protein